MDTIHKYILGVSVVSFIVPTPILYIAVGYTAINLITDNIKKYLD